MNKRHSGNDDKARAMLERIVEAYFGGNDSAAAEALGISQPYVHDVLSGKRGPLGDKLVAGVATLMGIEQVDYCVGDVSKLMPPNEWMRLHSDTIRARARAAVAARALGTISQNAIDEVLAMPVPNGMAQEFSKYPPEFWLDRMRHVEDEIRMGLRRHNMQNESPHDEFPPDESEVKFRGANPKTRKRA